MTLPVQIQKIADIADKYYEEQPAAEQPVVEQPADEQPVVEQAVVQPQPIEEDWAQKYRTLQGMFNSQVPALNKQNKELQARVQQMEQLLASVSQSQASPQSQPQSAQKFVTEDDVSEYGESIDMMRRVAKEEIIPLVAHMRELENALRNMSTVVPKIEAVQHHQAMTAEEQFWARLGNAVPNWPEVDNDPGFHQWLLEADPLTGMQRQAHLEDARRNLDVNRVAAFFNVWSSNRVVQQPTGGRPPVSELEKQVAPSKSRTTGAPTQNNAKQYSASDIAKFYEDVRKGMYKGKEAERDRIERDIFSAQREGRIT